MIWLVLFVSAVVTWLFLATLAWAGSLAGYENICRTWPGPILIEKPRWIDFILFRA